jgi:hypothetical protein
MANVYPCEPHTSSDDDTENDVPHDDEDDGDEKKVSSGSIKSTRIRLIRQASGSEDEKTIPKLVDLTCNDHINQQQWELPENRILQNAEGMKPIPVWVSTHGLSDDDVDPGRSRDQSYEYVSDEQFEEEVHQMQMEIKSLIPQEDMKLSDKQCQHEQSLLPVHDIGINDDDAAHDDIAITEYFDETTVEKSREDAVQQEWVTLNILCHTN